MTPFEIPTNPQAQTFTVSLAGVTYTLTIKWNSFANCWILDISDINGNAIVGGLALVTGCDLLWPFKYLLFGGALNVETDHAISVVPSYTTLGSTGHLYFVTP